MLLEPVGPQVVRVLEEPSPELVRSPSPGGKQEVGQPAGGAAPSTREGGRPQAVGSDVTTKRVAPSEADSASPPSMTLRLLVIVARDSRELGLDPGDHAGEHGAQVVARASIGRGHRHPLRRPAIIRHKGRAHASPMGTGRRRSDDSRLGAERAGRAAGRVVHFASGGEGPASRWAMLAVSNARGTHSSINLRLEFRSDAFRRVVSAARSRPGAIHPSSGHRDQAVLGSRATLATHRARGTHTTTRSSWQQNN